jgi:membrane protease YdiL (CAAX protease family)
MTIEHPPRISLLQLLLYLLAAGVLVALCGGAVVLARRLALGPTPPLVEGAPFPLSVWLTYVAVSIAVLVAYRLQARFVERRPRSELAWSGLAGLPVGAAVGIVMTVSIVLVLLLGGAYRGSWHGIGDLLPPTLMAVGAALSEEVLIRGFVLGLIERRAGSLVALLLSAVLFGVLHFDNAGAGPWPIVALIIGPGLALGAAYLATGRLWLPLGLHFGWNFGQSGLFGLLDSGTSFPSLIDASVDGPFWLTGGAFGPEASLPGVAVWVLLGAALLRRARRQGRLVPYR